MIARGSSVRGLSLVTTARSASSATAAPIFGPLGRIAIAAAAEHADQPPPRSAGAAPRARCAARPACARSRRRCRARRGWRRARRGRARRAVSAMPGRDRLVRQPERLGDPDREREVVRRCSAPISGCDSIASSPRGVANVARMPRTVDSASDHADVRASLSAIASSTPRARARRRAAWPMPSPVGIVDVDHRGTAGRRGGRRTAAPWRRGTPPSSRGRRGGPASGSRTPRPANSSPATRSIASADDDTSITTWVTPAALICANAPCRTSRRRRGVGRVGIDGGAAAIRRPCRSRRPACRRRAGSPRSGTWSWSCRWCR